MSTAAPAIPRRPSTASWPRQIDPTATSSGNISISTGGQVIAGTGIAAFAQGGANIAINSSAGLVTGNGTFTGAPGAGDGIFAQSVNGSIGITTGAVTSVHGNAIEALNMAAAAIFQ